MANQRRDEDPTLAYYSQHAREYVSRTNAIDMSTLYTRFDPLLPESSLILDLGCGGGRDARHFSSLGHHVIGMDPCSEILSEARRLTPPEMGRIHYLAGMAPGLPFADASFTAIWACASLLHIPRKVIPQVVAECFRILRKGGVIMISVKQGAGEAEVDGRWFTNWEGNELRRVVEAGGFAVFATDELPSVDRRNTTWLSMLMRKT